MASDRIEKAIALLEELGPSVRDDAPAWLQAAMLLINAGRDDLLTVLKPTKRPRGRQRRSFDMIENAREDSKRLREHGFSKLEADTAAATRLFARSHDALVCETKVADAIDEMARRDAQGTHTHRAK